MDLPTIYHLGRGQNITWWMDHIVSHCNDHEKNMYFWMPKPKRPLVPLLAMPLHMGFGLRCASLATRLSLR